jgi:hypothetical protein
MPTSFGSRGVAAQRCGGEVVAVQIYTTDSIPLTDRKPISKAWLVAVSKYKGSVDDVLSELKAKAAEGKADAIIGVRVVATEVADSESFGKTVVGGTYWTAYGTAVKHPSAPIDIEGALKRMREMGPYVGRPIDIP